MPPQAAEVLSALKLLRDTPNEIINTHRDVALETLSQIRQALGAKTTEDENRPKSGAEAFRGSLHHITTEETQPSRSSQTTNPSAPSRSSQTTNPSAPTQMNNCSGLPDCDISNHIASNTKKRKRQVTKKSLSDTIIKSVKKKLCLIRGFCKSRASLLDILQTEQELQFADKRVDHLKQVDGNRKPSEEQKLLKGLSQLSLAQQFRDWEIERGWKARVDALYNVIQYNDTKSLSKPQRLNSKVPRNMTRFIRDHSYPEPDQNVVRKGIQRGTNQLLFQEALKYTSTSPAQNEAVQGILVLITIFEYALFQTMDVSELPALAKSVLQEHDELERIPEGHDDESSLLLVSAKEISPWFENMRGDFEMISQTRKRGRRNVQVPVTTAASNVEEGHVDPGTHAQSADCSSENCTSNCLPNHAEYPSMNSHELTTFSTFPGARSSTQRRPSNTSFDATQRVAEEVGIFINTASHNPAEIVRNTRDVNGASTGNSEPYRLPHDIGSFCTIPSGARMQQPFIPPQLDAAFPGNSQNSLSSFQTALNIASHELSSFSTIPAR